MDNWPIPKELLIVAIEETIRKEEYTGYSVDNWGELEAAYCRSRCGEQYRYVETDWIRHKAINLRKAGLLSSVNGGAKRKRKSEPSGKYAEYLNSDHWKQMRMSVMEYWSFCCCLCKAKAVDVHHNTYVRIGSEYMTDCVALCRACHSRVHGAMPDGNDQFETDGLF